MQFEIKSASYTYSPGSVYQKTALSNVPFTINKGEFVGIMGQTGSGKSTLLQLLGGLLKPDCGSILFNGEDIHAKDFDRRKYRKNIGMLFQFPDYQLFESTVFRDVAFGLKHLNLSKQETENAVKNALQAVGFSYESVKNKSPLSFSGGEKKRLALAGVLAAKPQVLLLDEPVAGLDFNAKADFISLVKNLNANGTTVVMVCHSADVLAECASRVLVMQNGSIAADDKTANVLANTSLLAKCGLQSAQVYELSQKLRQNGICVGSETIRYSQLLHEICKVFGRDNV